MFPPAPEAKSAIDFDGKGFTIDGERAYLASGSMHYPRVPAELWHDRLLRMKRGGFNVVQTYTFWNYHEPQEGQFDFGGSRDVERYLEEAQKVGLYATVRVGPYVCAEWDSGGYPIWLKWKPDLLVRQDNPAYVAAQDAWLKINLAENRDAPGQQGRQRHSCAARERGPHPGCMDDADEWRRLL